LAIFGFREGEYVLEAPAVPSPWPRVGGSETPHFPDGDRHFLDMDLIDVIGGQIFSRYRLRRVSKMSGNSSRRTVRFDRRPWRTAYLEERCLPALARDEIVLFDDSFIQFPSN
jgi:hypothetical protein